MEPEAFFTAYPADVGNGVHGVGGSGSERRAGEYRPQPRGPVGLDLRGEPLGIEGKPLVHLDLPQIGAPEAGNAHGLFER